MLVVNKHVYFFVGQSTRSEVSRMFRRNPLNRLKPDNRLTAFQESRLTCSRVPGNLPGCLNFYSCMRGFSEAGLPATFRSFRCQGAKVRDATWILTPQKLLFRLLNNMFMLFLLLLFFSIIMITCFCFPLLVLMGV